MLLAVSSAVCIVSVRHPKVKMTKRKYPFEDCCNYMRQLKMHVTPTSVNSMSGDTASFPGSYCNPAMVDTFIVDSPMRNGPLTQGSSINKKIQLFVNMRAQLSRTTQLSAPSPSSVTQQICCQSCYCPEKQVGASSSQCHFCEKMVCDACIQLCVNCKEEFCVLCSVKIYRPKEDVTLCLSCS